jgi:hypothetical protein
MSGRVNAVSGGVKKSCDPSKSGRRVKVEQSNSSLQALIIAKLVRSFRLTSPVSLSKKKQETFLEMTTYLQSKL